MRIGFHLRFKGRFDEATRVSMHGYPPSDALAIGVLDAMTIGAENISEQANLIRRVALVRV